MKDVFVRNPYNYDMDAVSLETGLSMFIVDPETGEIVEDKGVTQQEFKLESDINEIVRRFGLTGRLPDVVNVPVAGDFTGIQDYHSALLAVRKAEESFMELPASLRARFNNNPQLLMEFMADASNRDEAVKLGLVTAPVVKDKALGDVEALKGDVAKPEASGS